MAENAYPVSRSITLDSREEAVLLFGTRDQNLRMVRDALGTRLVARGDQIQIDGTDASVGLTERAFERLRSILRANGRITSEDVRTVIEVVRAGTGVGPGIAPANGNGHGVAAPTNGNGKPVTEGGKYLRPRTEGQTRYVQALRDHEIVIATGPAGTGKTFLAVGMAVTLLRQGVVKKIVLVRPAVEAGERLGFLPGDLVAKINPYLRPLFDSLNDLMDVETVKKYIESEVIEICPLAYMRGRTLNNAVIILDEGQNATVAQMKMFLTRMGQNSRIIVTGDLTQTDLPPTIKSGLGDAVRRLTGIPRIAVVNLAETDIVRHPLVMAIVKAYDDEAPRRRPEGALHVAMQPEPN